MRKRGTVVRMIVETEDDVAAQEELRRGQMKWAREDYARARREKKKAEQTKVFAILFVATMFFVILGLVLR